MGRDPVRAAAWLKEYREKNKEACKQRCLSWRMRNPEKVKELNRRGHARAMADPAKVEKARQRTREWNKNNPGRATAQKRERRKTDLNFKLRSHARSRLWQILKKYDGIKRESAIKLLGCSIDDFKKHIESQFRPGMTWDNWSPNGWHIDHIKPLAVFDFTDLKQQQEALHYTNMQPLWWMENLLKAAKVAA